MFSLGDGKQLRKTIRKKVQVYIQVPMSPHKQTRNMEGWHDTLKETCDTVMCY